MKSLKTLITLSILSLALSACGSGTNSPAEKTNQLGGISVGNPTGEMTWSGSGVSVHYDKSLNVEASNERSVTISNKNLLKGKTQKSAFKLDVISAPGEGGPKNQKELKQFVRKREKTNSLTEIKKGAGQGYLVGSQGDSTQKTERAYLMGANGAVVMIATAIIASAVGATLVDAIPNTIDFDVKAPLVKAIRFTQGKVSAGQSIQMEFDIEEETPGLEEESIRVRFENQDHTQGFARDLEFESRNGNSYISRPFRLSEFLPAGTYQLARLSVNDIWLNARLILRDDTTGKLLENPDGSAQRSENEIVISSNIDRSALQESKINSARLEVVNDGKADLEFPKINSVKLLTPEVKAGEDLILEIDAEDDVAGLDSSRISVKFYNHQEDERTIEVSELDFSNHTDISEKDGGRYLVKISIPKFAAPKDLVVASVSVGDRSGKATSWISDLSKKDPMPAYEEKRFYDESFSELDIDFDFLRSGPEQKEARPSLPRFNIRNDGVVDQTPPAWISSQLEKNDSDEIWKWNWNIQIKDSGSGVFPKMYLTIARVSDDSNLMQGWDDARATILVLEPLGDDKYKMDMSSLREELANRNDFKPGNYIVSEISFRDEAENKIYFKAYRKNEMEVGYSVLSHDNEPLTNSELEGGGVQPHSFKTHRKVHSEASKFYEVNTTWSPFKNMNFGPSPEIVKANGQFPVIEFTVK